MNSSFILQEMGIVLSVPQQDPTFFNLDFLIYTGIVPDDWEVSCAPIHSSQSSQVAFQNDVSLIAEPHQTLFLETLGEKSMSEIEVPKVATRFTDIMKNMAFTELAVNFRGYVAFPDSPNAAHNYFFKVLLAPGEWHDIGSAPIRAGLNLVFTFPQKRLNFTIQEAAIRRLDESSMAALIFSGAFESNFSKLESSSRLAQVQSGIQCWDEDLKSFINIVSRFFQQPQPQDFSDITVPLS